MIMHKLLSRRSSRLAFFLCLAVGGVDHALPGQTAVRRLDAAHFHPGLGGGIGVRAQGVPRPKLRVPEDGSPGKSTRVRDWHLVSDVGLYYGEDGLGPALACTFDGHLGITIRNRRRLRGPAQEQADGLPFWPGELTLISGPVSLSAPAKMYRNPDDGMTDVAYEKGALFLRTLEQRAGFVRVPHEREVVDEPERAREEGALAAGDAGHDEPRVAVDEDGHQPERDASCIAQLRGARARHGPCSGPSPRGRRG